MNKAKVTSTWIAAQRTIGTPAVSMKRRFTLAFLLAFVLSGCSTVVSKTTDGFGNSYSGVAHGICINRYMLDAFGGPAFLASMTVLPFSIINIGLSGIMDTVVLPIDLVTEVSDPQEGDCGPARRRARTPIK